MLIPESRVGVGKGDLKPASGNGRALSHLYAFSILARSKKNLRWSLPFLANVSFSFISPLLLFFPLPPRLVCPLPSASPKVLWPLNLEGFFFFSVCPGLDPGNALGQPRGGSPGARLYSECRAPPCLVPWVWDSSWFHQWFQSLPWSPPAQQTSPTGLLARLLLC